MRKMKDMSEDDLVRQMETVKSMSPKQARRPWERRRPNAAVRSSGTPLGAQPLTRQPPCPQLERQMKAQSAQAEQEQSHLLRVRGAAGK